MALPLRRSWTLHAASAITSTEIAHHMAQLLAFYHQYPLGMLQSSRELLLSILGPFTPSIIPEIVINKLLI